MKKVNTNLFIENAKKKHGNRYDYSLVNYINVKTKVEIICPIHGKFLQKPNNHLSGKRCKKCNRGKVFDSKDFIEFSNKIHNNKYNYDKSDYVKSHIKITITCKLHGDFTMIPNNHLRGQGCRKCFNGNYFNRESWIKNSINKTGIFYIIRCWNENEEFYKIGITTYPKIQLRYNTNSKMPYKWQSILEIKSNDLGYIWDLEFNSKLNNKEHHYLPLIYFKGCKNECFKQINFEEFLNKQTNGN